MESRLLPIVAAVADHDHVVDDHDNAGRGLGIGEHGTEGLPVMFRLWYTLIPDQHLERTRFHVQVMPQAMRK